MQDILPTIAHHAVVAFKEPKNSQPRFRRHPERRFVRNETVRNVRAATRYAEIACVEACLLNTNFRPYRRTACPVWWLHDSRCMYCSSVSPSQRTLHSSLKRNLSTKCVILSKLTTGPCLAANGKNIATRHRETHSPPPKAEIHGLNKVSHVCVLFLRTCFASKSHGPAQTSTKRCVLLAT